MDESTKDGNPPPSTTSEEAAAKKDSQPPSHPAAEAQLQTLPIESIDPSPHQVREVFDEEALRGLAASMRQEGLLQPILVRPVGGRFQIVAGERRIRAAKLLGWTSIRALVEEASDLDAAVKTMIENEQRQDANPLERARGYKHLKETFNLQQEDVAARVGVSSAVVSRLMSLLKEPPEIQELLASGTITPAHVHTLDEIQDPKARVEAATQAAEKHWTASETKRRTRKAPKVGSSEDHPKKGGDSTSGDSPVGNSKSSDALLKVAEGHVSQVMRWISLLRWLFNWLRRVAVRLLPNGRERRVGHLPPPDPDPIDPPDPVEPSD